MESLNVSTVGDLLALFSIKQFKDMAEQETPLRIVCGGHEYSLLEISGDAEEDDDGNLHFKVCELVLKHKPLKKQDDLLQ